MLSCDTAHGHASAQAEDGGLAWCRIDGDAVLMRDVYPVTVLVGYQFSMRWMNAHISTSSKPRRSPSAFWRSPARCLSATLTSKPASLTGCGALRMASLCF